MLEMLPDLLSGHARRAPHGAGRRPPSTGEQARAGQQQPLRAGKLRGHGPPRPDRPGRPRRGHRAPRQRRAGGRPAARHAPRRRHHRSAAPEVVIDATARRSRSASTARPSPPTPVHCTSGRRRCGSGCPRPSRGAAPRPPLNWVRLRRLAFAVPPTARVTTMTGHDGGVAAHGRVVLTTLDRAQRGELGALDRAVYAAVASTPSPPIDAAVARISNAANYSRLWMVTAALLGATGPAGRRAALVGLAAGGLGLGGEQPGRQAGHEPWPARAHRLGPEPGRADAGVGTPSLRATPRRRSRSPRRSAGSCRRWPPRCA